MANTKVMVVGASRGLGLEFTRQWLHAGCEVHALARDPRRAEELHRLSEESPSLVVDACDVTDDESVEAALSRFRDRWASLDILINNAGTAGPTDERLANLDLEETIKVFDTNVLGPIRMLRGLAKVLEQGTNPRAVQITSRMGSIADNESGAWWAYRMSKAALNMATKNAAIELGARGITCVVLHPGWVRTDMGGPNATLSVQDSVAAMIRIIQRLGPSDNGCFFGIDGEPLPW